MKGQASGSERLGLARALLQDTGIGLISGAAHLDGSQYFAGAVADQYICALVAHAAQPLGVRVLSAHPDES